MASTPGDSPPSHIPIYNLLFEISAPVDAIEKGDKFYSPSFTSGKSTFTLLLQSSPPGLFLVQKAVTDDAVYLGYELFLTLSPQSSPLWSAPCSPSKFSPQNSYGWGCNFELEKWDEIKAAINPQRLIWIGAEIYDHPDLRSLLTISGEQKLLDLPVRPPRLKACMTVYPKSGASYLLSAGSGRPQTDTFSRRTRRKPDFKKSLLTDFVVCTEIDDVELYVHRFTLASANSFFEGLFSNSCEEMTTGRMVIKDIPGNIMKDVLNYLYTGFLEIDLVNVGHVLAIWKAAVEDLLDELLFVFRSKNLGFVTCSTCCEVLVTLAPYPKASAVVSDCVSFIADNFAEVTELETWSDLFIPFASAEGKKVAKQLWNKLGESVKELKVLKKK
ncbi:hypothetical protein HDU93_001263 [Gonapodya sp. JEL0774]|nr:hypothetical protein HDU93_001263 [Gonapodya sp. JEL0774]